MGHPDRAHREASRWARIGAALPWIAIALYGALAFQSLWSDAWRPAWDSGIYVLTGQSLARGEGYTYLGQAFGLRPPGFSFLLSLAMPGGHFEPRVINALMIVLACTALAGIYVAFRSRGVLFAASIALLTGTHPFFAQLLDQSYSEFPFMALVFLSAALLQRSKGAGPRWWLWSIAGAVALGASIWMRTVGLLVLPGLILLAHGVEGGRRKLRVVLPLVTTLLVAAPWLVRSGPNPALEDQLLLSSYSTAMFHEQVHDPQSPLVSVAGWVERISSNGLAALQDVARTTLGTESLLLGSLLAGLIVIGLVITILRERSLLEWMAASYLALLLTYFTYDHRLMTPFVPFLYSLALAGPLELARRFPERAPLLPQLVTGLVLVAGVGFNLARFEETLRPSPRDQTKWDNLVALARWAEEHTEPEDRLVYKSAPSLSVLANRTVYTERWAEGTDLVGEYGIDYVLLARGPASRPIESYASRAPRDETVIFETEPNTVVYRMTRKRVRR